MSTASACGVIANQFSRLRYDTPVLAKNNQRAGAFFLPPGQNFATVGYFYTRKPECRHSLDVLILTTPLHALAPRYLFPFLPCNNCYTCYNRKYCSTH